MVHAGCVGILTSCYSLDIAGMELVDPLSADINASSMITLMQFDKKRKICLKIDFWHLRRPIVLLPTGAKVVINQVMWGPQMMDFLLNIM